MPRARLFTTPKAGLPSPARLQTSAALASASLLLRPTNATFANQLLAKAQELYRWGADVPGGGKQASECLKPQIRWV